MLPNRAVTVLIQCSAYGTANGIRNRLNMTSRTRQRPKSDPDFEESKDTHRSCSLLASFNLAGFADTEDCTADRDRSVVRAALQYCGSWSP